MSRVRDPHRALHAFRHRKCRGRAGSVRRRQGGHGGCRERPRALLDQQAPDDRSVLRMGGLRPHALHRQPLIKENNAKGENFQLGIDLNHVGLDKIAPEVHFYCVGFASIPFIDNYLNLDYACSRRLDANPSLFNDGLCVHERVQLYDKERLAYETSVVRQGGDWLGPERRFIGHGNIISMWSRPLDHMFCGRFAESSSKCAFICDVVPATFDVMCKMMYYGVSRITVDHVFFPSWI